MARVSRGVAHRAASLALSALLAALALGVLGMQALSAPGAGHHTAMSSMGTAMLSGVSDGHASSPHDPGPATGASEQGHGQGHGHDALMLCGVMLAAVGIAGLLMWLLDGAWRQWRQVLARLHAAGRSALVPSPRSRGHSPPLCLAYSVIRC